MQDFLGERVINLHHVFTDAQWSQAYARKWNLQDPQRRVDAKHRQAQLKHFGKQGLGLIELKVEFIPAPVVTWDRRAKHYAPG